MTFVETLVLGIFLAICIAALVRWSVEKRRADLQRLKDKWEDG